MILDWIIFCISTYLFRLGVNRSDMYVPFVQYMAKGDFSFEKVIPKTDFFSVRAFVDTILVALPFYFLHKEVNFATELMLFISLGMVLSPGALITSISLEKQKSRSLAGFISLSLIVNSDAWVKALLIGLVVHAFLLFEFVSSIAETLKDNYQFIYLLEGIPGVSLGVIFSIILFLRMILVWNFYGLLSAVLFWGGAYLCLSYYGLFISAFMDFDENHLNIFGISLVLAFVLGNSIEYLIHFIRGKLNV